MADSKFHFRQAFPSDWPWIWPIFHETAADGDTYPYPPDISEFDARRLWLFDGAGSRITYVAERAGVIVGTAYLKPNNLGLADHVANAGWIVGKSSRGLGIGRDFAAYVLEEARNLGFHGMQFNAVVSTNKVAIVLWKSLGFEIVGTVPDAFRHPAEGMIPIHIMYLRL